MVVFSATLVACTLESLGDEETPAPEAESERRICFLSSKLP